MWPFKRKIKVSYEPGEWVTGTFPAPQPSSLIDVHHAGHVCRRHLHYIDSVAWAFVERCGHDRFGHCGETIKAIVAWRPVEEYWD